MLYGWIQKGKQLSVFPLTAAVFVILITGLLTAGCGKASGETETEAVLPQQSTAVYGVMYEGHAAVSGPYVEDGTDGYAENVAVILVTNTTDRFLDLATLTFTIDGKPAAFVVSGLPPNRSAWVQEAERTTVTEDSAFVFSDCMEGYRDDVTAETEKIRITAENGILTAENRTDKALKNVFIYYKTLHTDGNFFGGITYAASFGDIGPGESASAEGAHFSERSEIVRIGWSEE